MTTWGFFAKCRLVWLSLSVVSLTGCVAGTMVAYEGRTLPKEKIAVVTTPPATKVLAQNVTPGIHCINGRRATGTEVHVLPGKLQIVGNFLATPAYGVPIGMKQFVSSLEFEAQAGHEYHVNGGVINSQPLMWVQDITTKQTVTQSAATDHSYKAYTCKDEL